MDSLNLLPRSYAVGQEIFSQLMPIITLDALKIAET